MSKMFQVYGLGQAFIPVLPPPIPFKNPPSQYQKNYEIGQLVYSPPANPTAFYMYAGSGNWASWTSTIVASGSSTLVAGTVTIANSSVKAGDIISITRTALNASPALGFLIYTINPGVSISVTSYTATGTAATTDVSSFSYTIARAI